MSPMLGQLGVFGVISCLFLGVDAESLVAKLGSPRYADREAASSALAKMGPRAIPLLREARQDQDPEVKSRAELLLDTIEQQMLTQARTVTIPAGAMPAREVLASLAETQGVNLRLQDPRSGLDPAIRSDAEQTLTFWQVMDRLELMPQWEPSPNFGFRPSPRSASLRLIRRQVPMLPLVDDGPFRIIAQPTLLLADVMPFDGGFRQPRPGRILDGQKEIDLVLPIDVIGEPRLTVRAKGPVQILEAIDNDGKLIPVSPRSDMDGMNLASLRERASSLLSVRVRLRPETKSIKMIKRIKGIIPVEVEARQTEPTVISLNPSTVEFRTVPCGETSILVHSLKPPADGSGQYELEASFRQDSLKLTGRIGRMPNRRLQELLPDSDPLWSNLEVVNASGQPFTIVEQESVGPLAVDGEVRKRITLQPPEIGSSPPTEIRFYGQIQASMDLSFEFHDLRTP